mgnify:CR=1 FL=1
MKVGLLELEQFIEMLVLSLLESGKVMFSKPTWGWQIHVLTYLRVAPSNHFQTSKHEIFCSNSGDPVYTCMLCASHSKSRLITGIRTQVFSNTTYHVSRGHSLIGRAGALIAWPSPLIPKFPSRGNSGDDGHVALCHDPNPTPWV